MNLFDGPSPDLYSTERGIPHAWRSTSRSPDAVGELSKNLCGIPVCSSDVGSVVMSRKVGCQTLSELSRHSPIGDSRHLQNRKRVVRLYQAVVVTHCILKESPSRIAAHNNRQPRGCRIMKMSYQPVRTLEGTSKCAGMSIGRSLFQIVNLAKFNTQGSDFVPELSLRNIGESDHSAPGIIQGVDQHAHVARPRPEFGGALLDQFFKFFGGLFDFHPALPIHHLEAF
jgi:hypothetical protein